MLLAIYEYNLSPLIFTLPIDPNAVRKFKCRALDAYY